MILMDSPQDDEFARRNPMVMKQEEEKLNCSQCGDEIYSGHFTINETDEIYCDEECLLHNYSEETYEEMNEKGKADYI